MHNAPLKFWIPSRWYWYLILMIARLWNPDRTARSDRKNLEPLSFAVLLASRIVLEDKSRDPCEPRSDLTVLRTMIEPFLTVLASLWICSLKKKKKTHTHTQKNRRKKKQLLEVHHVFINTATAISRKTQHAFMFLFLLSSEYITQLPLFKNSSLGRIKL